MRMAKAFIAAALLAVALVGAVVVPAVLTHGEFGFDDWPDSSAAQLRTETVAIDASGPGAGASVARSEPRREPRSERRSDRVPAPKAAPALPDRLAGGPRPRVREATPPATSQDVPAAPQTAPVETPQPDPPAPPAEELADSGEAPVEAGPEVDARPAVGATEVDPPDWGLVPGPVGDIVPLRDWLPRRHHDDTK
jgi:hypothetical protein